MKTIIIGGTAAGTSAAVKVQKLAEDPEVVIYEKGDLVSLGACGLPYYIGDYFEDANQMIAREKAAFEKQGITIKLHHEVLAVDTTAKTVHVKPAEGEEFIDHYDKLMVATGSSVVLPPVKRVDFVNLYTVKTMSDGKNLKKHLSQADIQRVTIVGGGYIGVEIAEALLHLGKEVQLIQMEANLLQDSFDSEINELMAAKMRETNVDLHLSETVKEFEGDRNIRWVITDKGRYKTDLVIVAIGVRPATAFLGKEFATLKNGALIVDNQGRTNVPDVWSAGDCATVDFLNTGEKRYIPLATGANKLGRVAGESMAGKATTYPGSLGTAGVKFQELEMARTGLTEREAKDLGLNYKAIVINDKNQTNYYPGQKDIRIKLIYEADTRRILGGQIAGENGAALRIDTLAAAITGQLTTETLGLLDLMYAPPFARTWDALNIAGNVAK
ncbi:CoA-disulfide reductase [Enterococcus asini]|uniref:CoA-disulfide reductase n=1 Tax=Enterococcus asini TaxID=57732 RepID=UPI001E35FCD1|nr:CoA-disulfide reductase [Enterococcus asini]MCD5028955.1 CoA-disulfide reductase [Enterococcus asini]